MNEQKRFRVLALDGGGVKGTYTASVLECLERLSGKSICEHFDLVVGTSTGGIIAIAIGLGIPLSKVLDLYIEHGPTIFPIPARGIRARFKEAWRHAWQPKHSQEVLAEALNDILGDRVLGESKNRLVIPAFNAVNGDIHLFKTAHAPAYKIDHLRPAVEVALSTSAAPTYFSAYHDSSGNVFVDGGVWANCPAAVAVTEASSILGWPLESIDVLSIGTTSAPYCVAKSKRRAGLLGWNKGLLDLFQEAQVKGMLGIASALTAKRLVRIDTVADNGRFSLDGAREISDLRSLGENSARQTLEVVSSRFLETKADSFVPFTDCEAHPLADHSLKERACLKSTVGT